MQANDCLVAFDPGLEKAPGLHGSAADKVAKYNWLQLGQVGEFKWIDKRLLLVDRSYQRDDKQRNKITEIASEWKWESCGAISVMQRNGASYYEKFMVVDGQNRTLAAWRRSDIIELPCMVFQSKGIGHEAKTFIEINTNRRPVSSYEKFRAKIIAEDRTAIEILSIIKENQLVLKADGNSPGTITCIASCQRLYAQSPKRFRATIRLASDLAKADLINVCQILIGGLGTLDRKISNGFSDERLVKRLHEMGAKALVVAARKMSYQIGRGGEVVWAEGMLELINKKRGAKFLMERRHGDNA
jgi:hypothetical protein